jgi:transcriptional regulator with XRE-family HTH domain
VHETPTQVVARNVRAERERRYLSAQDLSDRIAADGSHVTRSMIANLETGRVADLGVNLLVLIARALHVAPWSLTNPFGAVCLTCANTPAAGLRCIRCHREG